MSEAKTNQIIRYMAILTFLAGFTSMFFKWPVDHPLWFDGLGLCLSVYGFAVPHKVAPLLESIINKKINK